MLPKAGSHLCWLEILRKFDLKGFLEIRSFNPSFELMRSKRAKGKWLLCAKLLTRYLILMTTPWGRQHDHCAHHVPNVAQLACGQGTQGRPPGAQALSLLLQTSAGEDSKGLSRGQVLSSPAWRGPGPLAQSQCTSHFTATSDMVLKVPTLYFNQSPKLVGKQRLQDIN